MTHGLTKTQRKGRRGLTLIELIVVLVILVALAGILIPMLPNMLGRAHTASASTNCSEINKFVQTYQQLYSSYPQNLDALTDTTGSAVPDYILNGATPVQLSMHALTPAEASALSLSGVTTLAEMQPNRAALAGQSPTFNPYMGNLITVAAGTNVIQVSEDAVENVAGLVSDDPTKTGDVYVAFGLGKRCTMIGKVVSDPPTHFGEGAGVTPNDTYARYLLIFRVARGNGTATPTPLERAVFIGTADLGPEGISGTDGHLQEYYQKQKAE